MPSVRNCASEFHPGHGAVTDEQRKTRRAPRSLSMRHQVKDHVDAEGIGHLLGELVEVFLVLTFSFPTIADVAVVNGEYHHPSAVVEQGPDVHFPGAFPTVDPLERR